jgi:hypothetical protein
MPYRFASMDGATTHPFGAIVGGNDNRLAPEQGIGLLFNGGKAGIQVNVHDQRLVAVNR